MATYKININDKIEEVDVSKGTHLLWVIREHLGLMGTKFSCGIGACGACTVHIDGEAKRSCVTPIDAVANGQNIRTIEGLSSDNSHPVQQAWLEMQVPQCGYCQSGQIMQAAALLNKNPKPNKGEIIQHMTKNLCRCGTYVRIIKAVESAAEKLS
ncbi:MAG: (2Fe-2S)-binding protein [Bacteroidota bacterium]